MILVAQLSVERPVSGDAQEKSSEHILVAVYRDLNLSARTVHVAARRNLLCDADPKRFGCGSSVAFTVIKVPARVYLAGNRYRRHIIIGRRVHYLDARYLGILDIAIVIAAITRVAAIVVLTEATHCLIRRIASALLFMLQQHRHNIVRIFPTTARHHISCRTAAVGARRTYATAGRWRLG
uniref:Uncharacterized protein n=1 Tax=Anopheles epiroticus TaxID=199890 RepID=A0A182PQ96_9DIPT